MHTAPGVVLKLAWQNLHGSVSVREIHLKPAESHWHNNNNNNLKHRTTFYTKSKHAA